MRWPVTIHTQVSVATGQSSTSHLSFHYCSLFTPHPHPHPLLVPVSLGFNLSFHQPDTVDHILPLHPNRGFSATIAACTNHPLYHSAPCFTRYFHDRGFINIIPSLSYNHIYPPPLIQYNSSTNGKCAPRSILLISI